MTLFQSNSNCAGDAICAMTCPVGIIQMVDGKPTPTEYAENTCISCGHCVAVCPHSAMDHSRIKTADCPVIDENLVLNENQVEQFLRTRRSIRTYKDQPVSKEKLTRLVELARYGNTGHNSQTVKWHVTDDRDKIIKMVDATVDWMNYMIKEQPEIAKALHFVLLVRAWKKGHDGISRNAPAMITAYSDVNDRMAPQSSMIALSYLELAAPALNLGTCWAGFMFMAASTWPGMKTAIGLSENDKVNGMVLVGHPKFKYHRMPLRKEPVITWHE